MNEHVNLKKFLGPHVNNRSLQVWANGFSYYCPIIHVNTILFAKKLCKNKNSPL